MALTDDTHVETIEEGGGREIRPEAESIDIFFELLAEAQSYMKEMQRHAGRLGFVTTKLTDRMNDWLDMKEQEAQDASMAATRGRVRGMEQVDGQSGQGAGKRQAAQKQQALDFVEAATLEEAPPESQEET